MLGVTKHLRVLIIVLLAICVGVLPLRAQAASVPVPPLALATNPKVIVTELQTSAASASDEFIELYNITDSPIDFEDAANGGKTIWKLQFFSATSTATGAPDWTKPAASIGLVGTIAPHNYFLLASQDYKPGGIEGDQNYIPRLADTGGGLQLIESSTSSSAVHDRLMWLKSTSDKSLPVGVLPAPGSTASIQRLPGDDDTYVRNDGILTDFQIENEISPKDQWVALAQPIDPEPNTTDQDTSSDQGTDANGNPAQVPPEGDHTNTPDNTGLTSPLLTELLPNPTSPLSDSSDEYIEMYNPNDKPFSLKDYAIEVGITTLHDFTFRDGELLAPLEYKAFYARDTHLTLTNTGSLAKLLDPAGNTISQTQPYESAADGLAWAFDGSQWMWTTEQTPNAVNKITAPIVSSSGGSSTPAAAKAVMPKATVSKLATTKPATKSTNTKTKASGTTKTKKASTATTKKPAKTKLAAVATKVMVPEKKPIHSGILVLVVVIAVLYAAYEYRQDIQNYILRLRRNRTVRAYARQ